MTSLVPLAHRTMFDKVNGMDVFVKMNDRRV